MLKGSCLCGAVHFEIADSFHDVEVCHCVQCRKWTGRLFCLDKTSQSTNPFANMEVPRDSLKIQGEQHITWFHSSAKVRRGFCAHCGSTMFFDPLDVSKHQWIAVAMGALDSDTGGKIKLHIFTAEKGDYYDIPVKEESR
jgi:hypothetical protein